MCEFVQKNITKGMLIYVEGTMHHYKSPKDESKYMNILCNHPSNLRILSGSKEVPIEEELPEEVEEEK
jgi:single-stranded DNA-binding protein